MHQFTSFDTRCALMFGESGSSAAETLWMECSGFDWQVQLQRLASCSLDKIEVIYIYCQCELRYQQSVLILKYHSSTQQMKRAFPPPHVYWL